MKNHSSIDFICLGAAKSGTTWLWKMLKQHPDIYTPSEKELNYFNPFHGVYFDRPNPNHSKGKDWYNAHFLNASGNQVKGEVSSSYLKFTDSAKTIFDYNPNIKLLAILRHPVERVWSQHQFLRTRGYRIDKDLFRAIENYPELVNNSLYNQQLRPYYEYFNKDQILVLSFDELKENPSSLLSKVFTFLNVKEYVPDGLTKPANSTLRIIDEKKHARISFVHRKLEQNRVLHSIARRIGLIDQFVKSYNKNLERRPDEKLSSIDYEKIYNYFIDDLKQLKQLIPKSFNHW